MPDQKRERILNVDDNDAGRYATTKILKHAGFGVIEAVNGTDAIRLASDQHPDLVLLDVNLPDISGFEVCKRLKQDEQTASIPIVHLSATYVHARERVQGLDGGADGYLVHPIEPEEMVASIRSFIRIRNAEKSLRASETRYRRLFESAKDGILILDRETSEIIDANPFIKTLTGYAKEELIGKKLWDIGFFNDQLASKIAFGELQTNDYIRYEDLPLETKDGKMIEVEFISNIYLIDQNQSVVQCNIRDITGRKEIEHQREALIRELAQKNAELERFTYTVSHELKSPLITIKVFAGHIAEDARKGDLSQLKNDIDRINAAAGTMLALLSDLLDLARVGRIDKIPEQIPFATIAHEAAGLLAVPLNERHVTVTIAPDLPDVYVDHARIRDALVNLIENTIKFFGEQTDPVTRIGMDMRGGIPVFFVQDNGIGIDHRYLERVFNLFEKLDASVDGTGIGLAIVRRIIEEHGGKIWAESDGPGKGTTFRFTLPGVPGDRDVPVPGVV